jgi:hypothetical protein
LNGCSTPGPGSGSPRGRGPGGDRHLPGHPGLGSRGAFGPLLPGSRLRRSPGLRLRRSDGGGHPITTLARHDRAGRWRRTSGGPSW